MNVAAVRTRYEHINHSWRRSTPDRRAALIGELELLSLQLPAAVSDDRERKKILALRTDIQELVNQITIGQAGPDS